MTTARDLCTRALRVIGVTEIGEAAANEDLIEALSALNDMMHGLKGESATIEWDTLGVNDVVPLSPDLEVHAKYALAGRLIIPLGMPDVDAKSAQLIQRGESILAAHFQDHDPVRAEYF